MGSTDWHYLTLQTWKAAWGDMELKIMIHSRSRWAMAKVTLGGGGKIEQFMKLKNNNNNKKSTPEGREANGKCMKSKISQKKSTLLADNTRGW